VQLKEASEQNLEVTNMVDFKKKVKEQKRKDRERAGKKRKSVTGDRLPRIDAPSLRSRGKSKDSTGAIMKGIGNLFASSDPDPGISGAYDMPGVYDFDTNQVGGWKNGGRIKKGGKRKRAALRGQRSELRGS
jgi:hypothetical protein